jgi:protein-S-isoprenylcysteine O-methyltransferase Ste14
MVTATEKNSAAAWFIALRMVVYTVSFLAFILGLLPWAFHRLGVAVGGQAAALAAFDAVRPIHSVAGAALFAVGLLTYLGCSVWLAAVGRGPFVEFDPPRQFVASGPYRWTRNPVAAALLLTVLGEGVYFGSPGVLALFVLGLPLAHLQVTWIEEPRLARRFGATYEEYCRKVPRWWPRRPSSAGGG